MNSSGDEEAERFTLNFGRENEKRDPLRTRIIMPHRNIRPQVEGDITFISNILVISYFVLGSPISGIPSACMVTICEGSRSKVGQLDTISTFIQ